MAVFGDKLRKLSLDGSKRFGADYNYDVEGEIAKYTEIAPTVKVRLEVWICIARHVHHACTIRDLPQC